MEEAGLRPTRTCKDCELFSDNLGLFVKNKGSKYERRNLCIACCVKRNEKHPKKRDWKTNHQVNKRYGISLQTYMERMSTSDCCQICTSKDNLCYDHDHETMEFRGVLCRSCNVAIGQLGDNVEMLQKALDYMKSKG